MGICAKRTLYTNEYKKCTEVMCNMLSHIPLQPWYPRPRSRNNCLFCYIPNSVQWFLAYWTKYMGQTYTNVHQIPNLVQWGQKVHYVPKGDTMKSIRTGVYCSVFSSMKLKQFSEVLQSKTLVIIFLFWLTRLPK